MAASSGSPSMPSTRRPSAIRRPPSCAVSRIPTVRATLGQTPPLAAHTRLLTYRNSLRARACAAFWAATFGFFTTFFSCFAPSALGSFYKKPPAKGGLGLNRGQLTDAGAFAVAGTILMRVAAGPMCDVFGARKTFACLLVVGLPGMIIFALAEDVHAFTAGRIIIGLSLATFVTCQVWCSQFFSKPIVGTVNATAGGWGNLGGAITLLLMPQIVEGIYNGVLGSGATSAEAVDRSWRLAMIVPACMHCITTIYILMARDLPDGSYKELEAAGVKQKSKGALSIGQLLVLGFSNTNALIMLVTYGLCFGVELCMNNKLVPYFTDYYGFNPNIAGPLAACFGLMNLFARSWGGILSDYMHKRMGLRGRITAMWIVQTIEGFFCIAMGLVTIGDDSLDDMVRDGFGDSRVQGVYISDGVSYVINNADGTLPLCSSDLITAPATALVDGVETAMPVAVDTLIMIYDPAPNCVHNASPLGLTVFFMICFSSEYRH